MRTKKRLAIVLSISLMFSLVFSALTPALAKSTREAVIDSVVGEVNVTKSGGSKSYQAFEGMTLNQGDHIETGVGSKVVVRIVDHDDEITIDENASFYISELSENTKGKKSKMKMWAGSLWSKVKTLTGTDDEFTVQTPTAVMGVQGTTLLVGVDPETGESKFFIASGQGKVSKNGEGSGESGTTLSPNQSITLDNDTPSEDYEDYSNIADLDGLISNTSNAIIEAILASKAAMDQENSEYIAQLQAQQDGSNQEAIDRINQNLDNLVGNIINNAISQGKVDEAAIKAFIEKLNEQMDKKLDLDNVKEQLLSDQEKAKQAQVKLLEAERQKKQEAEKLKQEQLKKQNEDLQKKLKDQLEKQKAEKEKAAEAAKQKAAEEFAKKLTNDAAKLAFEAKQKALADEKEKQAKAVADAKAATAPVVLPATGPGPGPSPDSDSDSDSDSGPTIKGNVQLVLDDATSNVKVMLKDFGSQEIYGIQLHFTYNNSLEYQPSDEASGRFSGGIFVGSAIEARIDELPCNTDESCRELLVVATKYKDEGIIYVNDQQLLVTLPFWNYSEGSTITLVKVIIVGKNGEPYIPEFNKEPIEVNFEPLG